MFRTHPKSSMPNFFGYFLHKDEQGNLITTTQIPVSQHLLCGASQINKQYFCLVGKERLEEAACSHSLPRTPEDAAEDLVCNAELHRKAHVASLESSAQQTSASSALSPVPAVVVHALVPTGTLFTLH